MTGDRQDTIEGTSTVANLQIAADLSGPLSTLAGKTIVVVAEDPDRLFNDFAPTFSRGTGGLDNVLTLFGNSTWRRAGRYVGPLRVHVCLDSACGRELAGSPVVVPYDITIRPGLKLQSDSPVVVTADFGATPSAVQIPLVLPQGSEQTLGYGVSFPNDGLYRPSVRSLPTVDLAAMRLTLPLEPAPVGTHAITVTMTGRAQDADGNAVALRDELLVNYVVRPVAGLTVALVPASADILGTVSGFPLGLGGEYRHVVVAADGALLSQFSRVVYTPRPGGSGVGQSAGFWLDVHLDGPSAYRLVAYPCPPDLGGGCLPLGRYVAEVYFQSTEGVELPLPLPVTMTLN